ncbi:ribonuclease H-like domain-containing protein [Tanacetum coccineum]
MRFNDRQIMDKCKTRLGYNVVPPPYTGNFMPPKSDLVYPSLDDFVDVNESVSESVVEKPTVETNEPETSRKKIEPYLLRIGYLIVMKKMCLRPFNKITAANNSNFTKKVNTVKGTRVNTARPKAVLSAVKGNKGNAVKASACWVWKPKTKVIDHVSKHNNYEEIDGGFVAFGGNSKGGKITGKRKIKTGKLDFKDVYFVKELKFNLFSVSQMCDKKNSVLFTDTECVVLSPDFKLTDESHVLLKVPRKDNMYSVYLKNVIPQGGLTCLFAKATPDESNLWHMRLGHVNFKIMNKLVRGNLVRGIENLIDLKVKVIRCDNETEFKNRVMNQFCEMKGRKPALSFMRPFRCPVTILNTIDHLGKFDGKADEGFFVGYSTNSKAFRVFNSRTRIVEENLHVKFSEDTPNIAGSRPNWLFDIDALTKSINYKPVVAGNQSNGSTDPPFSSSSKDSPDAGFKPSGEEKKKDAKYPGNEDSEVPSTEEPRVNQEKDASVNSTNTIKTVSPTINTVGIVDNAVAENIVYGCADDPNMPELEEISRFSDAEDDISGADMNNLDTYFQVSSVPTTRIHKDHPIEQIIRDLNSAPQTRRMTRNLEEHDEPEKVIQALKNPSWIEAMQEELLQFKLQQVWTLMDLPNGKMAIRTKWVYKNKTDERGIVIKNEARLVAQGYT